MHESFTSVYLQPIVIEAEASSEPTKVSEHDEMIFADLAASYPLLKRLSSDVPAQIVPAAENRIVRQMFSSIPIIRESELTRDYQELGDVLNELVELGEEDEWKIDAPVFDAARYVAAELMALSFPAPHVFNHGPKSIVFNWSRENNNLYLTISADKMSALVSTPERIKQRVEFTFSSLLNPAEAFSSIRAAQIEKPIILVITSGLSQPLKFIG